MQWHASWTPNICYSMCKQEHRLDLPAAIRRSKDNWSEGHLADASEQRRHRIKTINHSIQMVTCTGTGVRSMHSYFAGVCSLSRPGCRNAKFLMSDLCTVASLVFPACAALVAENDKTLTGVQHVVARSILQEHREDRLKQVLFHYAPAPHHSAVLPSTYADSLDPTWGLYWSLWCIQNKSHRKGARSVQNVKAAKELILNRNSPTLMLPAKSWKWSLCAPFHSVVHLFIHRSEVRLPLLR